MKRIIYPFLMLSVFAIAQENTGINTTNPKTTLQIDAKNADGSTAEGIIIPKITGDAAVAMLANLSEEEHSMMVYVTTPPTTRQPKDALNSPGYYRYQYIADDGNGNPIKTWVALEPSGLQQVFTQGDEMPSYRLISRNSPYLPTENLGYGAIDLTLQEDNNVGAQGEGSIAMGYGSKAIGDLSVAISSGIANGLNSFAFGESSITGQYADAAVAFSSGIASGGFSVAISGGTAAGENSVAISGGTASADNSYAFGRSSKANGVSSIAILGETNGKYSIGIQGGYTDIDADMGLAVGYTSRALAPYSMAIGGYLLSTAKGNSSISFGGDAIGDRSYSFQGSAKGDMSFVAIGGEALNFSELAFGENFSTDSTPDSIGSNRRDLTKQLFSVGYMNQSNNQNLYLSKANALIILRNAHTGIGIPSDTQTPENSKPTEMLDVNGNIRTRTINDNAGATTDKLVVADANGVLKTVPQANFATPYTAGDGIEITNNEISRSGLEQITENGNTGWRLIGANPNFYGDIGSNAIDFSYIDDDFNEYGSVGDNSFATGYGTIASGIRSFATGYRTKAIGDNSFVSGYQSVANNKNTFAIGFISKALGENSFAGGYSSESTGKQSFSFGGSANAIHNSAIALGSQVIADSPSMLAIGTRNTTLFNSIPLNYSPSLNYRLFVVGDGSYNSPFIKSDAFAVLYGGKVGVAIDNFETNSSDAKLQVNGKVLIGDFGDNSTNDNTISSAPSVDASLNVIGDIKIGSNNISCNATNEGSLRYVSIDADNGAFQGCKKTNGIFNWVTITP